mmetsp:Transcript_10340/g.29984  ORF Transcript_10340/g.29984 Transcript_10340/m.29984 type:complete len:255 (-) Transcript_10340:29-793(-)
MWSSTPSPKRKWTQRGGRTRRSCPVSGGRTCRPRCWRTTGQTCSSPRMVWSCVRSSTISGTGRRISLPVRSSGSRLQGSSTTGPASWCSTSARTGSPQTSSTTFTTDAPSSTSRCSPSPTRSSSSSSTTLSSITVVIAKGPGRCASAPTKRARPRAHIPSFATRRPARSAARRSSATSAMFTGERTTPPQTLPADAAGAQSLLPGGASGSPPKRVVCSRRVSMCVCVRVARLLMRYVVPSASSHAAQISRLFRR